MRVKALNAAGQTVCGFESKHSRESLAIAECVRLSREWNKSEKRPQMVVKSVVSGESRSYLPGCDHMSFFEPNPLYSEVVA